VLSCPPPDNRLAHLHLLRACRKSKTKPIITDYLFISYPLYRAGATTVNPSASATLTGNKSNDQIALGHGRHCATTIGPCFQATQGILKFPSVITASQSFGTYNTAARRIHSDYRSYIGPFPTDHLRTPGVFTPPPLAYAESRFECICTAHLHWPFPVSGLMNPQIFFRINCVHYTEP